MELVPDQVSGGKQIWICASFSIILSCRNVGAFFNFERKPTIFVLNLVKGNLNCQETWDRTPQLVYGSFTNITQFIIPFATIVICYTKIIIRSYKIILSSVRSMPVVFKGGWAVLETLDLLIHSFIHSLRKWI